MVRITEELIRKSSEHNEGIISTLEELALHQRDIEKIEHLGSWCRDLKILDLTSNMISKIENLHKLKKLEYLKLGLNNIERIENLEGCEFLQKLDLTVNFIGELTSVESLADLEHLHIIYLMGNPCTEFDGYREFVITVLPHLKQLDGHDILKSERIEALQKIHEIRPGIIQQQKRYFIKRQNEREATRLRKESSNDDEQTEEVNTAEDEEAEEKRFWDEKVPYTPESRQRVHDHIQRKKEKEEMAKEAKKPKKPERKLVADDGRILCINEAKFDFTLMESEDKQSLILDIAVFRYMDTSQIDVDVNPMFVRGFIKGKIFQLVLPEEVQPSTSKAQRVQSNGHLVLTMPKVKQVIKPVNAPKAQPPNNFPRAARENARNSEKRCEFLEVDPNAQRLVDYTNIVDENGKPPVKRIPLDAKQPWWAQKFEEKPPSSDFVDDPDVPPLM